MKIDQKEEIFEGHCFQDTFAIAEMLYKFDWIINEEHVYWGRCLIKI